jgi:hypothetical protein
VKTSARRFLSVFHPDLDEDLFIAAVDASDTGAIDHLAPFCIAVRKSYDRAGIYSVLILFISSPECP